MYKVVNLGEEAEKFSFDKNFEPAVTVASGDIVALETGRVQDGRDRVLGPIYVEGAKLGDALAVTIRRITLSPAGKECRSTVESGRGLLEDVKGTIQKPLGGETRELEFTGKEVLLASGDGRHSVSIGARPFIGTIAVAPRFERHASDSMGKEWCGKVDCRQLCEGATVRLPVRADGGLLFIGGPRAAQGDGNVTGLAFSGGGTAEVQIELIPKAESAYINWPQLDDEKSVGVISIVNRGRLSDAMANGYVELARRMEGEFGIPKADGYALLGLAGEVRVGGCGSCVCRIERKLVKEYGLR